VRLWLSFRGLRTVDCCPCVEKLRAVLPVTVGIRNDVAQLVSLKYRLQREQSSVESLRRHCLWLPFSLVNVCWKGVREGLSVSLSLSLCLCLCLSLLCLCLCLSLSLSLCLSHSLTWSGALSASPGTRAASESPRVSYTAARESTSSAAEGLRFVWLRVRVTEEGVCSPLGVLAPDSEPPRHLRLRRGGG
jgi:hypothetical protein